MFFRRQSFLKKNTFQRLPKLEILESRLVPAGEFSLHSLPGASKVIYLDFDGHTTSNTAWLNGATIITPAYDIDNNPSTFSTTELNNIRDVWERVVEDFLPFNVDVTTEDPGIEALRKTNASDTTWGIRCVIGENTAPAPGAGGVAFLNSFSWNTDTPCFVFSGSLGGVPKNIAEAASHEVGHTLNLSHDGTATLGYYPGHGSGPTGWAPIMGVGYYQNLSQWSKGEYSGADNLQDDLSIITNSTNGFGYRNDDYGSNIANAAILNIINSNTVSMNGIIERNTDLDYFRFNTVGGTANITINPVSNGPNLDISATLYNSSGGVVARSNPIGRLDASFNNLQLQAGSYYLAIDGVGEGNILGTGYSDYGSLGYYSISGTIPPSAVNPVITGPSGGPGATLSSSKTPENSTNVFTFTADRPVVWSIAGGSDETKFSINPTSGLLTFTTSPNYEIPTDSDRNNTYIVIVKATGSNGASSQQTLTVSISDVADTPPLITGPSGGSGASVSSATISENTTSIYTFKSNRAVTWSISGGSDASKFKINNSTGELSFINAPDYETPTDSDFNNTYSVVIKGNDPLGFYSTQTVNVTIRNINENPTNPGTSSGAKIVSATPVGLENGFISGFKVVFSKSIIASSFTSQDIFFTSPSGVLFAANNPVSIANSSDREFNFSLVAVASENGVYNLRIGLDILDINNNKLNQNGNAINGEIGLDVFSTSISNTISSIIISNNRQVTLADNNKTYSQITINQNLNIRDLNVAVNLTHINRSDLIITIKSPWGQIVTLSNRRGGTGDHFSNTLFDDSAALSISSLSSTGNGGGTYRPESPLSIFNGKNAKGIWTITVEDRATGNTGTLNSWKLNFLSDTTVSSTVANSDGGTVSSSVSNAKIVASIQQTSVASTQQSSFQSASFKTIIPIVSSQTINLLNAVAQATISPSAQSNAASQPTRTDALFGTGNPFSLFNF